MCSRDQIATQPQPCRITPADEERFSIDYVRRRVTVEEPQLERGRAMTLHGCEGSAGGVGGEKVERASS
jgi:hypothetical protein